MLVTKTIAKKLTDYGDKKSVGNKLRSKRIGPLLEMIEVAFREHGVVNIIDIGGTEKYWGIIPQQYLIKHNVNITIVNIPGAVTSGDHGIFRFIEADACDLAMFSDQAFHVAHSNSVVEHVGDWNRMLLFANELSRVSQKYFVQTPNYWFPVEPHCMTPFFHWLPKPIRVWLVSKYELGHWTKATSISHAVRIVESARLLNKKMFQELFEISEVKTEWFFGFPKSYIAVKK